MLSKIKNRVIEVCAVKALPSWGIALPNLFSWAKKSGFAIMDQGLLSGANMLLNILLARWLEPSQYGVFTVAYAIFLLLAAFHSAMLTEPMLVFGAGKYADRFQRYLGILFYSHWGITGLIMLILAFVAVISWWFGSEDMARALAGLAVASPFILFLWLARWGFYVNLRPQWAAMGSGLYIALLSLGMYGCYREQWLSPASALVMMGGVSLVVGLGLAALLCPQWNYVGSHPTLEMVIMDHWRYGRWATVTIASTWLSNNIYYLLLPMWVGLEGSAVLRAVMNLVLPILHVNAAISELLLPRFVRVFQVEGKDKLHHFIRTAFVLFTISSILYWCFLLVFRHNLLLWFYGGRYIEYADLCILAGLLPFSRSVVNILSAAFRAMERPDLVFGCHAVSVVVTLTLGLWLLAIRGVGGAVAGQLISTTATAVVLVWLYKLRSL